MGKVTGALARMMAGARAPRHRQAMAGAASWAPTVLLSGPDPLLLALSLPFRSSLGKAWLGHCPLRFGSRGGTREVTTLPKFPDLVSSRY